MLRKFFHTDLEYFYVLTFAGSGITLGWFAKATVDKILSFMLRFFDLIIDLNYFQASVLFYVGI